MRGHGVMVHGGGWVYGLCNVRYEQGQAWTVQLAIFPTVGYTPSVTTSKLKSNFLT